MKKYYCCEDQKIYTEDELLDMYCQLVKEDASYRGDSFADYIRNCTSKNGSLTEVRALDSIDRYLVKCAAEKFWEAFKDFHEILTEKVNEGSFNDSLSEGYPFSDSFDAMRFVMGEWMERLNRCLDDLYR